MPLQLQGVVEKETEKYLEKGHKHRMEKIADEVYIHTASSNKCQTRQTRQKSTRCQIDQQCSPKGEIPESQLGEPSGKTEQ